MAPSWRFSQLLGSPLILATWEGSSWSAWSSSTLRVTTWIMTTTNLRHGYPQQDTGWGVSAWLVTCTCTWTRLHFTCACTGRNFPPSVREQRYLTARHHIFERSCCIITNPAPCQCPEKHRNMWPHQLLLPGPPNISRRSKMVRGRDQVGSCWNIIINVLVWWT